MLSDVALAHLRNRARLADRTVSTALRMWSGVDLSNLSSSWDEIAPGLVRSVTAAQVQAAAMADPYIAAVAAQTTSAPAAGVVIPESFGGVTLAGRAVAPEMYGAVTTTKSLIGRGILPQRAFVAGGSRLATTVGTLVLDMGRSSDMVSAVSRGTVRYLRVIQPGACSRCAILAGSDRYSRPFQRHPQCRCTSIPIPRVNGVEDWSKFHEGNFFESPEAYFESLSRAEQDRVFTKAGAEAIRLGASPISVVNARRGALTYSPGADVGRLVKKTIGVKPDGSPLQVYMTSEGTTRRSAWARQQTTEWVKSATDRYSRTTTIRLMPEQIVQMAGDDPDRMVELLRKYGYLY